MTDLPSDYFFDEDIDRSTVPALKVIRTVSGTEVFAGGVADMDFKAPPIVLKALQDRLDHGVFGYEKVSSKLIPALQNWLSTRHHWHVDSDHVVRSPNVLNSLAMAASLFTKPGDGIILQPPVFYDFFDILHENNRQLISNPLIMENNRYQMDFADLEEKASMPNTKMIYLCNPHNPVGRVWTEEELLRLGDICLRHHVVVVADELHGDIVYRNNSYTPFASLTNDFANNSLTCISPAKSFNIAACCSSFTIIPNEDYRTLFAAENSRLTVNKNNAFANVAMEAAYKGGGPWLDDVILYLHRNVDTVREYILKIPGVELIEPEGTFLVWLDFRDLKLSADELDTFLKTNAKWFVSRGTAFGAEGAGFARMNIACTHAKLVTAMDRLVFAVAKRD